MAGQDDAQGVPWDAWPTTNARPDEVDERRLELPGASGRAMAGQWGRSHGHGQMELSTLSSRDPGIVKQWAARSLRQDQSASPRSARNHRPRELLLPSSHHFGRPACGTPFWVQYQRRPVDCMSRPS